MKMLLFGGTGFLSSRILYYATRSGNKVLYVTRAIQPLKSMKGARHITADRDKQDLTRMLKHEKWDAVIDATCRTPAQARQAINLSKKCRRLIMVSTDYVYDPEYRKLPQNEERAVYAKGTSYGAKKRKAELKILAASRMGIIEATILRPPHIYGPGSYPGTIPNHGRDPKLLNYIKKGMTLNLVQGGLGLIQPIHVDDIARIVIEIVPKRSAYGEIYNCPGPKLMTHRDYYKQIASSIGREAHIRAYYPKEAKGANLFPYGHRYYDNAKLLKILPHFRFTSFEKGIQAWIKILLRK